MFVDSTENWVRSECDRIVVDTRVDEDTQGNKKPSVSVVSVPPSFTVVDFDHCKYPEVGRSLPDYRELIAAGLHQDKRVVADAILFTDDGLHMVFLARGVVHAHQDPVYAKFRNERGCWYERFTSKNDGSTRIMYGISDNGMVFAERWNKVVQKFIGFISNDEKARIDKALGLFGKVSYV